MSNRHLPSHTDEASRVATQAHQLQHGQLQQRLEQLAAAFALTQSFDLKAGVLASLSSVARRLDARRDGHRDAAWDLLAGLSQTGFAEQIADHIANTDLGNEMESGQSQSIDNELSQIVTCQQGDSMAIGLLREAEASALSEMQDAWHAIDARLAGLEKDGAASMHSSEWQEEVSAVRSSLKEALDAGRETLLEEHWAAYQNFSAQLTHAMAGTQDVTNERQVACEERLSDAVARLQYECLCAVERAAANTSAVFTGLERYEAELRARSQTMGEFADVTESNARREHVSSVHAETLREGLERLSSVENVLNTQRTRLQKLSTTLKATLDEALGSELNQALLGDALKATSNFADQTYEALERSVREGANRDHTHRSERQRGLRARQEIIEQHVGSIESATQRLISELDASHSDKERQRATSSFVHRCNHSEHELRDALLRFERLEREATMHGAQLSKSRTNEWQESHEQRRLVSQSLDAVRAEFVGKETSHENATKFAAASQSLVDVLNACNHVVLAVRQQSERHDAGQELSRRIALTRSYLNDGMRSVQTIAEDARRELVDLKNATQFERIGTLCEQLEVIRERLHNDLQVAQIELRAAMHGREQRAELSNLKRELSSRVGQDWAVRRDPQHTADTATIRASETERARRHEVALAAKVHQLLTEKEDEAARIACRELVASQRPDRPLLESTKRIVDAIASGSPPRAEYEEFVRSGYLNQNHRLRAWRGFDAELGNHVRRCVDEVRAEVVGSGAHEMVRMQCPSFLRLRLLPELARVTALERVAERVGQSPEVLAKAVTEADRFEREATDEEVELRMRVMEEVHKVVGSSLSGFIEEVEKLDAPEAHELAESLLRFLGGFKFDLDVWSTVKGREVLTHPCREIDATERFARREEIRAALRSAALESERQPLAGQRDKEVSERQDRSTHQLVANVWRDVADVTFPGFSERFESNDGSGILARFFDTRTGELQGWFEREITSFNGRAALDFQLNFRFDLPRMFRGGRAELIPGKGTPTHMAVTFQMMRMLELQPNALVYARGKQIQNLETAARVAQLRTEGFTLEQAAEHTHTHRYITATLLGLGYNAQLESVDTSDKETRLVEDIAYFQNNRRFWDSDLTPGRTRLQGFLERYDLGLESKLEMDWDFIYRLYAIGEDI